MINELPRTGSVPTAGPEFATLIEILRWRACDQPDQKAYTFLISDEEENSLTYAELDRQSRAIGAMLQRRGATGERVLLLYPPGLEYIVAFFGCLYASAIAVPAYPPRTNRSVGRIQSILADAQVKFILTTSHILPEIQHGRGQDPSLLVPDLQGQYQTTPLQWIATDACSDKDETLWHMPQVMGNTLAFLQYTSGSTSAPKGVMVSHSNLIGNHRMLQSAMAHPVGVPLVSWLPLFHDMGLIANMLQALYVGAPCILLPSSAFIQSPFRWLQAVSLYQAHTSGAPNFAYDLCVEKISPEQRDTLDLSSWKFAFCAAEPIRLQTFQRFATYFAPCGFRFEALRACYGLAETTGFATDHRRGLPPVAHRLKKEALERNQVILLDQQNRVENQKDESCPLPQPTKHLSADGVTQSDEKGIEYVNCGQAELDARVVIADPATGLLCPAESIGEIWIAGSHVAQGYWNRPEETATTFHAYLKDTGEGPFLRTGDLGFLLDGGLFVTGRIKDLIIIQGRNHYPQDIEQTVELCHAALRPQYGAAFSVESTVPAQDGEGLVIVQEVQREYGDQRELDKVCRAIRQAVTEEHDISVYSIVLIQRGSIPKTSSGKIQRRVCRQSFLAGTLKVVYQRMYGANERVGTGVSLAYHTRSENEKPLSVLADHAVGIVGTGQRRLPTIPTHERANPVPTRSSTFSSHDQEHRGKHKIEAFDIINWLVAQIAARASVDPSEIDTQVPFAEYGLGSLAMQSVSGDLERWLGRRLSPMLMYDYPTISSLAHYLLLQAQEGIILRDVAVQKTLSPTPAVNAHTNLRSNGKCRPVQATPGTPRPQGARRTGASPVPTNSERGITVEPIAIIGLGCRFPGCTSPEAFWQMLHDGIDGISEVPMTRWDAAQFYAPDQATPGKMNTRWGGFLQDIELFDPSFFHISPYEAAHMDPQQRLLLEVAWETLENAGQAPDKLAGSQTGVFIGISSDDSLRLQLKNPARIDAYAGTGSAPSIAANRLSYILDLHGPSIAIDTACSSSLVAVHQACQSLYLGDCDLALAGGVNVILEPALTITFSQARMMSSTGHCKTFDEAADGYVRSEGCGLVLLKPLAAAERDGDTVLAIIRGSAVNQDGRSNGLTAPNGPSQEAVIRRALQRAGIHPNEISYVEAHGSGTPLGDPIEIDALKAVLMPQRGPDQPCLLGAVKTNIGHLEAAAGIAGLIKTVLCLQKGMIVPNLHFKTLNTHISFTDTTFEIPTELRIWPGSPDAPRFAGVSAFGFGGTNAHVILEGAPPIKPSQEAISRRDSVMHLSERPLHLLTLSARTAQALLTLAQRYQDFLETNLKEREPVEKSREQALSLRDLCYTAKTGRTHFPLRLALFAANTQQMRERLAAFVTGQYPKEMQSEHILPWRQRQIVFLFPDQSSQYVNMAYQLYQTEPTFRNTLAECDRLLHSLLPQSVEPVRLLSVLYPASGATSPLDETTYAQPALFALEYALAQMWLAWGIEPAVVMGHGVGQYVAACIAGLLSLEDGLKLIAARGRLMQSLSDPHTLHSPLTDPMFAAFEQVAREVTIAPLRIPLVCNLTGQLLLAGQTIEADYWRRHSREPVQFATGIQTLATHGYELFLELGPAPVLSNLMQYPLTDRSNEENLTPLPDSIDAGDSNRTFPNRSSSFTLGRRYLPTNKATWLPSLDQDHDDWDILMQSVASLYCKGFDLNWSNFDGNAHKVALPTYPFEREYCWPKHEETDLPNSITPTEVSLSGVGILGKETDPRRDRGFPHPSDSFPHEKPLSLPTNHTLAGSPEALSLRPPNYLPLRAEVSPVEEDISASPVNWEALVSNCQTYRQTLAEPLADDAFLQVWQALQQIYLCVISKALQDFGIFGTPNEHYSVDELIQQYAIHPRYTKWLQRNLAALVQNGRDISVNLQEQNGTFTCEKPLPAIAVDELWPTYQRAVAGLTDPTLLDQGWNGHIPLLLFHRLEDLKTVLTEELHSAETYVSTEMREIYRLLHFSNTLIRTCVEEVVRLAPPGKKIRLLEVGAGFGTTTAYILPTLQAEQTEYVYTDISAYFLQEGREKFATYPNVSYRLLDIEKDPHAQGYTRYDFDIVIAANVLHTTAHIAETLQHIRSLLKPHAILILLEVTHMSPLLDLTMGLQQGFDRFEDIELRTSHPLLARDTWHKVLREQGFVSSAILNKAGTLTDFLGLDVLLAQAPPTTPSVQLTQGDEYLRSNLPEYTIPSRITPLETLPLTAQGKVDCHAPSHPLIQAQEHARSSTEARTPTEKTLVQLWSEVLQLSDVGIDKNFLELGGDSLLATKLLTRIRAKFNIEVSLGILLKNPTIALLAQTIEQGLAQGKDARSLPTLVAPASSLDKEEGVL